jgi:hypothetical protein
MARDNDDWPPKAFNNAEIEAMRRTWTGRRIPNDSQYRETITREQLDQLLAIATIYTRGTEVLASDITLEEIERLRHSDINIAGLTFEQSQALKSRACDSATAHFRTARGWRTVVIDALLEATPAQDVKALTTLLSECDPETREKSGYVKLSSEAIHINNGEDDAFCGKRGSQVTRMTADSREATCITCLQVVSNMDAPERREPAPYRCNVPMCGESGVCDGCLARGAR